MPHCRFLACVHLSGSTTRVGCSAAHLVYGQVVLLTVTCAVFLAAIVHTTVLMICTGWRYTLAWYDPLFPAGFSAVGICLLVVTIADAVLVQLRPHLDIDTPGYWVLIIFGLCMPLALAGPTVTLQMVLYKFSDAGAVNGEGGVL